MFKAILSYFWDTPGTDLSLDEAYSILNAPEEESKEQKKQVETEQFEYDCYHKTGTITKIDLGNNCYLIDDVYEFKSKVENLFVGTKIAYTLYVHERKIKVCNVSIMSSDWDGDPHENMKMSWCFRKIICRVEKRQGRVIFLSPGDLVVDLNLVSSEFIPIVGDWVEIDVKMEIDEKVTDLSGKILDIEKLRPLRPHIQEGVVKKWDSQKGIIDRNVFFNIDSLSSGYLPCVGDKIVTEVIESDQGACSLRSVKVVPIECGLTESTSRGKFVNKDADPDIYITSDFVINSSVLFEEVPFNFSIKNNKSESVTLRKVVCQGHNDNCRFTCSVEDVVINPKEIKVLEGVYKVVSYGKCKQMVEFQFESCSIVRYILSKLEGVFRTKSEEGGVPAMSNKALYSAAREFKKTEQMSVIKGEKTLMPPRFIYRKLLDYEVPEKLWNVAVEYAEWNISESMENIYRIKPCLKQPLRLNIYEELFHTLLHLEEIAHLVAIRRYDIDRASFIRDGEYFVLEVLSLMEKQPSLLIGDRVMAINPDNPSTPKLEGYIHKVGARHVYIKFAPHVHDSYNGEDFSIRFVTSRNNFRRFHQAVGFAVQNLGNPILFPTKVTVKQPQLGFTCDKYDDPLDGRSPGANTRNRNAQMLLALSKSLEEKATLENQVAADTKLLLTAKEEENAPPGPKPAKTKKTSQKLEWYNETLNYYQKEAVRNILLGCARPLPYVIFGPPGTGKSVTLVETILQLLKMIPQSRMLVAAPSNSAADLLTTRLIDTGLIRPGDLIRLVAFRYTVEDKISPKIAPYCATTDIARFDTNEGNCSVLKNGLTLGCNSTVIGRHRITISTCSTTASLRNMYFKKGHFTHIIIDEAGQASEPEIMVPLSFLDVYCGQAILAGDPLQLGAVVLSSIAFSHGLGESYIERLLNRFPYARDIEGFPATGGYDPRIITKLVYNYRSLPDIIKISSQLFYNSELVSTLCPVNSKEAALLRKVQEILPRREQGPPSVVFHGVIGENLQTPDSPSWFNPNEASQVFYYLNEFYRLGISSTDVGIISPYVKQVKTIRGLLMEAEFALPKIGTIEEFQGQEFNIIVLSSVRSNESFAAHEAKYNIGFISNPRRMNVALSRAQVLTVIVGNPHVLCKDKHWRTILNYCIENGSYCGCEYQVL